MTETLRPAAEWELQSMVAQLAERRLPVEIVGSGSKRNVGRPVQAAATISTAGFRGISLYEPTELVMSARSGTLLTHIEAELAARGQMLAFEPIDLGPATGGAPSMQTIGAVFSANLSGPRRISAGSARDHLLGIRGVNGRAETFKSGGRVMKNVTGLDVARGITGSWGTLAVITEATFKVLPMPETTSTLVYLGLPDDIAVEMLCAALGTPYEVSGTAHLSPELASRLSQEPLRSLGRSLTAVRLENFASAIPYRIDRLTEALRVYGKPIMLDIKESLDFWSELRRLTIFPHGPTILWRISTTPSHAPKLVAAIRRHMPVEVYYDWSGGLVWIETPASADAGAADVRRAVATHGGHATLIRAEPAVRAAVDVFQPLSPAVERLTRGLKSTFDPSGILNPGRMYANM